MSCSRFPAISSQNGASVIRHLHTVWLLLVVSLTSCGRVEIPAPPPLPSSSPSAIGSAEPLKDPQPISNQQLADDVAKALQAAKFKRHDVEITAQDDGVVMLTGEVQTIQQRDLAMSVTKQVAGVTAVSNNLTTTDKTGPSTSPANGSDKLTPQEATASAATATAVTTASEPTADKPAKPKREPIYDPQADAKALIAAAVNRARIEHKHVLIEFGGNWCGWCYKLHDVFRQDETVAPIVSEEFELVLIDSNSNEELMHGYGGKDRQYSYPHLTILDAAGQVLTNQETGSLEDGPKHVPARVADFLKKWSPERLDAETLLTAALKQAAAEDKSVLLQVGDPYCGWCKVLARFLDGHKETFDQDYVHLKIDILRMTHGKEVAARFQPGNDLGHPWMAILDPTGKALITSLGPQGNTGYPYEPPEIDHFLTMLTTTRKRLTDADLSTIRQHLNEFREERQRKQSAMN